MQSVQLPPTMSGSQGRLPMPFGAQNVAPGISGSQFISPSKPTLPMPGQSIPLPMNNGFAGQQNMQRPSVLPMPSSQQQFVAQPVRPMTQPMVAQPMVSQPMVQQYVAQPMVQPTFQQPMIQNQRSIVSPGLPMPIPMNPKPIVSPPKPILQQPTSFNQVQQVPQVLSNSALPRPAVKPMLSPTVQPLPAPMRAPVVHNNFVSPSRPTLVSPQVVQPQPQPSLMRPMTAPVGFVGGNTVLPKPVISPSTHNGGFVGGNTGFVGGNTVNNTLPKPVISPVVQAPKPMVAPMMAPMNTLAAPMAAPQPSSQPMFVGGVNGLPKPVISPQPSSQPMFVGGVVGSAGGLPKPSISPSKPTLVVAQPQPQFVQPQPQFVQPQPQFAQPMAMPLTSGLPKPVLSPVQPQVISPMGRPKLVVVPQQQSQPGPSSLPVPQTVSQLPPPQRPFIGGVNGVGVSSLPPVNLNTQAQTVFAASPAKTLTDKILSLAPGQALDITDIDVRGNGCVVISSTGIDRSNVFAFDLRSNDGRVIAVIYRGTPKGASTALANAINLTEGMVKDQFSILSNELNAALANIASPKTAHSNQSTPTKLPTPQSPIAVSLGGASRVSSPISGRASSPATGRASSPATGRNISSPSGTPGRASSPITNRKPRFVEGVHAMLRIVNSDDLAVDVTNMKEDGTDVTISPFPPTNRRVTLEAQVFFEGRWRHIIVTNDTASTVSVLRSVLAQFDQKTQITENFGNSSNGVNGAATSPSGSRASSPRLPASAPSGAISFTRANGERVAFTSSRGPSSAPDSGSQISNVARFVSPPKKR